MRRLVMILALIALVAAMPAPAIGASGPSEAAISVSVGEVHLVGKTLAKVDVTYVCTPPRVPAGYELYLDDAGLFVDIHQASGRRVASAEAGLWLPAEVCNGIVHRTTVSVIADGMAFKFGRAMVDVEAYAAWSYWNEDEEDWGEPWAQDATGWVSVRLHKR